MKTYHVEFVIAGDNELRKVNVRAKNRVEAEIYITITYGFCSYLVLNEI